MYPEERKKISFMIPLELWKSMKLQAVTDNKTMTDIFIEALEQTVREEFKKDWGNGSR